MNNDKIKYFLEELKQTNKLIIVEGPNDKKALENLTATKIKTLSKKPLFQIIEDISKETKEVIILTDFDKKGKELYGKLSKGFQRHGVKIDKYFREFLLKTKLSHIEGINTFLNNNSKQTRGTNT